MTNLVRARRNEEAAIVVGRLHGRNLQQTLNGCAGLDGEQILVNMQPGAVEGCLMFGTTKDAAAVKTDEQFVCAKVVLEKGADVGQLAYMPNANSRADKNHARTTETVEAETTNHRNGD